MTSLLDKWLPNRLSRVLQGLVNLLSTLKTKLLIGQECSKMTTQHNTISYRHCSAFLRIIQTNAITTLRVVKKAANFPAHDVVGHHVWIVLTSLNFNLQASHMNIITFSTPVIAFCNNKQATWFEYAAIFLATSTLRSLIDLWWLTFSLYNVQR